MTDQSVRGKMGNSNAIPDPRAQTLALQGLANRVVRGLLRTPGLSRAMGSRLVTLYIVGRKSGRRYTIPVAYTRDDGDLLIGTPFGWGRNLRTGEPVEIRLKGRRRQADVRVYTGEADVAGLYATMCRDNKAFANFNKIGFDADGNPNPEELHLAWMAGARAFRLTPRLPGSGRRESRPLPFGISGDGSPRGPAADGDAAAGISRGA
jgi:deazaflavin-dependent oxidoreductase (nitroreductase family)